jgi:pimeloyl-ACP methyl ester carboxylesterase
MTATIAANQRPDLIDHIVYVSAWCPVNLDANAYYAEPEMATVDATGLASAMVGNPADLGLLRSNFRTADPGVLAAFKAAFLSDGTDEEFMVFLNTFQPDESLDAGAPDDRAQPDSWGQIPRTYIRLAQDTSLPPAMQDRMIREGNALTPQNPYNVHTLPSSHLKWLVDPAPAPAARVLDEIAAFLPTEPRSAATAASGQPTVTAPR